MPRWLASLVQGAIAQRLRDFRLLAMATTLSLALAVVAAGFGTFAGYAFLRERAGSVSAALIVAAVCAALAAILWSMTAWRIRARRPRRTPPPPFSGGDIEGLLQSLAAASTSENQVVLLAAMRLARDLSPMQLLLAALVGGFIAGRKLGK